MLVLSHETAILILTAPIVPARLRNRIRDLLGLNDYLPLEGIRDQELEARTAEMPALKAITPLQVLRYWNELDPLGIPAKHIGTLHFLVPPGSSRRRHEGARPHQWNGALPPGSVIPLGSEVYLCTPEFCFLQLAASLDEPDLALLGMAMCGGYHPASCARGFVDRPPLTSAGKIKEFLRNIQVAWEPRRRQGLHGIARARRVANWLADNARSPLESSTSLLMRIPRSHGGYGLGMPRLNAPVRLSPAAATIFGRSTIRPDLLFREADLVVECLGKPYHKHPERDIKRELALKHDGKRVILLAYEQLKKTVQREELLHEIAHMLGKRDRKVPERYRPRRAGLLEKLLPSPRTAQNCTNRNYALGFPTPSWGLSPELLGAH